MWQDLLHSYLDLFLSLVVNLGGLLLQALLEFWPRTRINPMDEEENEVNHGKDPLLLFTGFPVVVNDWQASQVLLGLSDSGIVFLCSQWTENRKTGCRKEMVISKCHHTLLSSLGKQEAELYLGKGSPLSPSTQAAFKEATQLCYSNTF